MMSLDGLPLEDGGVSRGTERTSRSGHLRSSARRNRGRTLGERVSRSLHRGTVKVGVNRSLVGRPSNSYMMQASRLQNPMMNQRTSSSDGSSQGAPMREIARE